MTDEREKSGRDAVVADVYRELANERTPRHLDDKVLRMAAREGRTRYSLVRGWMRPVAWAATIALSLAIVMELTLFSGMDSDYASPAATEPLTGRSDAQEMAPVTPEPASPARTRQDSAAAVEEAAVLVDQSAATETRSVAKRSRAAGRDDADEMPGDAGELVPQALSIVRDAEELARVQAGPDQPVIPGEEMQEAPRADTASSPAFATRAVSTAAVALDAACSAEERKKADTWHACIERLREKGLDELAQTEDDAFREEDPDYEVTAGDR